MLGRRSAIVAAVASLFGVKKLFASRNDDDRTDLSTGSDFAFNASEYQPEESYTAEVIIRDRGGDKIVAYSLACKNARVGFTDHAVHSGKTLSARVEFEETHAHSVEYEYSKDKKKNQLIHNLVTGTPFVQNITGLG